MTYTPLGNTVILTDKTCTDKGTKVWTICKGQQKNMRDYSNLVNNVDLSCPVEQATPCTGNGNSFNFSNSTQTKQCVGKMPSTGNV